MLGEECITDNRHKEYKEFAGHKERQLINCVESSSNWKNLAGGGCGPPTQEIYEFKKD